MENIETILTDCIGAIKSGKATPAECLDRHHSQRHELGPLLEVALSIREPRFPELDISYKPAARAKLLQKIEITRQEKSSSFTDIFNFGWPYRLVRAQVAASILAGVILISSLAGGAVYASQGSLPGDSLYPVKTGIEDVRLRIAGDSATRVKLNLQFARTRLEEMKKLVDYSEEKSEIAVKGYQFTLEASGEQIRNVSGASALTNLLDGALAELKNQMVFCDGVIDADPEYVRPVKAAGSLIADTQLEYLRMLDQQNSLKAAQTSIDLMQDRLQRAQARAGKNQFPIMQEALLQYQQFNIIGEEILRHAQSAGDYSSEIEALSLQELPGYLETLDSLAREAPPAYENTIEDCRQMTLQFQKQAGYGLQNRDDSGFSPGSHNPGDTVGPVAGQDGQDALQPGGKTENTGGGGPGNAPGPSTGTEGKADPENGQGPGGGTGAEGEGQTGPTDPSSGNGGSTGAGNGDGSGSAANSNGAEGGTGSGNENGSGSGANSGGTGAGTGSSSGGDPEINPFFH